MGKEFEKKFLIKYAMKVISKLIGNNITANGGANQFFIGLILFTTLATTINWWFYNRKGCEKPS